MKNLQVLKSLSVDLESKIVGQCIDADNGALFVLTEDFTLLKATAQKKTSGVEKLKHDFDCKSIGFNNVGPNDVRSVEFVVESGSVLVALKEGYLISIGVTSFSRSSSCLYKHSARIASIKLSPDQDLIALADEENNILVLSIDCQIIQSSNALTQNESLHKPVGVGWGSKETQFFGLDGRPSKEEQVINKVILSEDALSTINQIESSPQFTDFRTKQERGTVIDWRGDGQYVATLTFMPDSKNHLLKVWNRNLELQYMSEQLVTVERGLLSWVPNGQYVCCAQRRDKHINEIAMFEKNGMVHQRVVLPNLMSNIYVKDMAWSPDSKILAIIVNQFTVAKDGVDLTPLLLMYTMQNFHYYLKFTSRLEYNSDYFLMWDPICQNMLHTISSNGRYSKYDCSFEVSSSKQFSTVAVVDTNKVFITPMQLCCIPPPMSAITLETSSPIYKVLISPFKASNIFILSADDKLIHTTTSAQKIQTEDESATLFKPHLENLVALKLFESFKNYKISHIQNLNCYQNISHVDENCLLASRAVQNGCEIVMIDLEGENGQPLIKTVTSFTNHHVIYISPNPNDGKKSRIYSLILDNNSVVELDLESGTTKPWFEFDSTVSNLKIVGARVIESQSSGKAIVSLGHEMSLRYNSEVIVSNSCTSFQVSDNYLVYTTTDHTLHFILIDHIQDTKNDSSFKPSSQPIEPGGTLINVDESQSKVILQMPRGNLEIIHPRILIFCALTDLLDKEEYVTAIKLARRHRLNLNFLADYLLRLSKDVHKVRVFAEEIAEHDATLLNLFVTELDESDTICDRYESIINHLPERRVNLKEKVKTSKFIPFYETKVNHICSTISGELPDEDEFLEPRLLCLLKSKPAEIQSALCLVHELRKDLQDEALKFILYFVDIDQLFSGALSTYDTDISLMVASASNKDPKEYLALLDSFNAIENKNLRCYEIDTHLKRHEKALRSLVDYLIDDKPEDSDKVTQRIVDMIESKRLYKRALLILTTDHQDQTSLLETVWTKYANYLLEKRHYDEAGVAYSKAFKLRPIEAHFNAALKCFSFVASGWERSIILIASSKVDESLKTKLLEKISRQLLERGHFGYALFIISREHPSSLASDLVSQGCWYLADFIANDEIRFKIRQEIGKNISSLTRSNLTSLSAGLAMAKEQLKRLLKLLINYENRPNYNESNGTDRFIPDTLSTIDASEVSSVSSGSGQGCPVGPARSGAPSIQTRTSSKSNKSQVTKKKRINLKPGSRHEDLALVLELKKYISGVDCLQVGADVLLTAMFEYCSYGEARDEADSFELKLGEIRTFSLETLELLWPSGPNVEQKYSLYRRFGANANISETYENADFEVLIKPETPRSLSLFNL